MEYGSWKPTAFDSAGLGTHGGNMTDRAKWIVGPVSRTRDSEALETSNFKSFEALLTDKCGEEDSENGWEIHRFGHWGPGWYEIFLLKPGSTAADLAAETARALADYPVIDEEDFSRREWEEAESVWKHCYNIAERVALIQEDGGPSIFAARRDEIPADCNGYLFDRLRG